MAVCHIGPSFAQVTQADLDPGKAKWGSGLRFAEWMGEKKCRLLWPDCARVSIRVTKQPHWRLGREGTDLCRGRVWAGLLSLVVLCQKGVRERGLSPGGRA